MTGETEETHLINALYTDDLTINRDGRLSETQKESLRPSVVFWLALAAMDILFLILLGYFQLRYRIMNLGYIWMSALSIIAARYCILSAAPYHEDIKNDQVKTASGQVFKRSSLVSAMGRGKYIGQCTVRVSDRVFTISPYFYDYVVNEGYYRFYFTPKSKRVVNIEEL